MLKHKNGLSQADIEQYSSHVPEQYLIPSVVSQNEGNCSNFSMIFYNTADRDGAHEEAHQLHDAFRGVGMKVYMEVWARVHDLTASFEESLNSIKDTCSFLVVCLMAHGARGKITDSAGTTGNVNNFFEMVAGVIPDNIPVVRKMTQICLGVQ